MIPFIEEIIKQDKKHDYVVFIDHEYFPFGSKSEDQLLTILKTRLKQFETYHIDLLIMACNTMSSLLDKCEVLPSYQIVDILSYNLKHCKDKVLLGTPLLHSRLYHRYPIVGIKDLAGAIEKSDIIQIIEIIKGLKKRQDYILACTHYPLAKAIFTRYIDGKIFTYHQELIASLPQGKTLDFKADQVTKSIILKYFPHLVIK